MSILKPEGSLTLGVAVGAMVYGVYNYSLPTTAVMQATQVQSMDIEAARRKAAITTVALVSVVSLMAKDKTIFVLGGLMVIALDIHARVANASAPGTGKVATALGGYAPARDAVSVETADAYA